MMPAKIPFDTDRELGLMRSPDTQRNMLSKYGQKVLFLTLFSFP